MPIEAPPWPGAVRPSLGRPAAPARGAETVAAVAGRARRPGPGAGRALYRGRRLRQEAGGGEGGATQLPGEGGGSAPGGHGAQPAAALTSACAPPAFPTQPRPRLHISSPAPLGPVSPETRPPQTWGKLSQLQTGREERAGPSPPSPQVLLQSPPRPSFSSLAAAGTHTSSRAAQPAGERARPCSPPGPQGLAGPLPAAAAQPGFPPRGCGSS